MNKHWIKLLLGSSALLLAASCGEKPAVSDEAPATAEQNAPGADAIAAAIASPDRWAADSERDALRKPSETLAFAEVAPGMSIFEIEAGGGYFTELFSLVAGPEGSVVMQNVESIPPFLGEEMTARLAEGRLANVRKSITNFDALDAEDGSIDLVTWVQGPHELYYVPEDGQTLGDPAASFAGIFRIVKPGGAFVVIDHSAVEGAPSTTGNELHRIDKGHIIALAETAGFVLDGEGDFLANPEDDRTKIVFDPSIRGKTDQFALRFRKAE